MASNTNIGFLEQVENGKTLEYKVRVMHPDGRIIQLTLDANEIFAASERNFINRLEKRRNIKSKFMGPTVVD